MRALLVLAVGCAGDEPVDPDPCAIGARVESVDDAVATVDDLPQPVTVDCFLTALRRPLGVELTSDVFNTQPAEGYRSPRILIRGESLTLTLVPVGEPRALVELGERLDGELTVKAELAFPIEGPLDPDEPYARTLAAPGAGESGCHVCHPVEDVVAPGRFANTELRPPDDMIVPLELLREEHRTCDPADDPDRCSMFSALLDHGAVYESRFPDDVATQFGPIP